MPVIILVQQGPNDGDCFPVICPDAPHIRSRPFNVSGQTKGVLQQDLAVSPDGSVHVVWRQFEENIISQGFASVFYAALTPGEGLFITGIE